MKIGWLADNPLMWKGPRGGAEASTEELLLQAPDDIIVQLMRHNGVEDADAFILNNVTSYANDIIDMLRGKPFVKVLRDMWPHGRSRLREYILKEASMLTFNSPLAYDEFPYPHRAPCRIIPSSPIDPERFHTDRPWRHREGNIWLGRAHVTKGLHNAAVWARDNHTVVDVYCTPRPPDSALEPGLNYCGALNYEDVPETLKNYENFVFLPDKPETYSRSTTEAWFAGCRLTVNGKIGVLHWIENAPELITGDIAGNWWRAVLDALRGVPDVSVIVPVYNCADTCVKAVRSALDQEGVRVEVLAVDANSPDSSGDVLVNAIDDPRLRIIRPGDVRLGAGNNAAIDAARGRYCQYLEGDDYLEPGCLRDMALALDSYPRVGFVYGQVRYHGIREDTFTPPPFNRKDFDRHNASLYPVMWRRELPARWHDFEAGIGLNDRDFILQLVEVADGRALPQTLVLHYNFRRGGAWHRMQAYMPRLRSELKDRHPTVEV